MTYAHARTYDALHHTRVHSHNSPRLPGPCDVKDKMADSSDSASSSTVRTVRCKAGGISTETDIASKIEKIIECGKNFRRPRTRKRVQTSVGFLDDCGRIIVNNERPRCPRKRINNSKDVNTGNG